MMSDVTEARRVADIRRAFVSHGAPEVSFPSCKTQQAQWLTLSFFCCGMNSVLRHRACIKTLPKERTS